MTFNHSNKAATLADFARSAVGSCRAKGFTEKNFVRLTDKVDTLEKTMTTAIKRDKIPSNLEALDANRDNLIRTLKALVTAAALHPDSAQQAAGKAAKAVFDKYGVKIARESYEGETTYVRSMLADFDAIASSVKVVSGLSETIDGLKEAEAAFEAEYASYAQAIANAGKSATELKKELVAALNSGLLAYIDAVSLVDDDFKALQAELTTILARM